MVMTAPIALPPVNTGTNTDRTGMYASAHATIANTSAGANRADMRPGIDAVPIDTGTGADDIADMAAGIHAMAAGARAGADRTDMGARADSIAADMGSDADTQNLDMCPGRIGGGGGEQGQRQQRDHGCFHRVVPVKSDRITNRCPIGSGKTEGVGYWPIIIFTSASVTGFL